MLKYVLKRIGLAIVTSFIILSLTFILVKCIPMAKKPGTDAAQTAYYDKQVAYGYCIRFDHEEPDYGILEYKTNSGSGTDYYYYSVPVLQQYGSWLKNIITKWEWGASQYIAPNVKATVIIKEKIGYSIKVNLFAAIFSVPLGIILGIWAALKKNTITDHVISTLVMVFISIPSFVLITFLMLVFAYKLKWIPTMWPNPTDPIKDKILGYILPVFCLSFGSICGYCRFTRAELCEVMESDYLLLARTKGLTRRQSIVRHALKNAMVPIFPSILAEVIGLFGGSMILEQLYGIPGIGQLFVKSLTYSDYNILFVDMAIFTTISLLSGVVLDLSYGFIDPRIRMGARK